MIRLNLDVRVEAEGALAGHIGLRLADVLLVEQKLPVQVAHVDRVQIDLKRSKTKFNQTGNTAANDATFCRLGRVATSLQIF